MASSLIQQKKGANTSTTALVIATTSNTVTGDTVVIGIIGNTNVDRISSVTATGMTFVKDTAASGLIGGGAASYISIWVAENVTGATTPSITVNKSATWSIQAVVNHYRGLATASADIRKRAGGTTTAASTGASATLTQADELVVVIVGSDFGGATYTLGAGYGNLNQQSAAAGDIAIEDKVVAATTAVTGTMTLSSATDQAAALITFKVASTAQNLTAPLISSTAVLLAMALIMILSGALIGPTGVVYAPTVALGPLTLSLPTINSNNQLNVPTLSPGPVTLSTPSIASTTSVPGGQLNLVLALGFIATAGALYAPVLTVGPYTLLMPAIGPDVTMYTPNIALGGVTLTNPTIASTSQLFTPSVARLLNPNELLLLGVG